MKRKPNKSQATSHEPGASGYQNISIIGDGAMGTVLAMLLCEKKIAVRMWGYDREQLKQIEQARENKKFLPGYKLPETLVFEPEDECIMTGADLVVSAVPCQFMRGIWTRLRSYVPKDVPIVSVAKGIEVDTLLRQGAGAIRAITAGDVLIVKFGREELQELQADEEVELLVSGEFADGTRFEGTDVIKVIDKAGKKKN